jgi:hypothetical protein
MNGAMIYTLAVCEAKRRVKDRIKKAGGKVWEYKARDIMALAHQYADQHRDELKAKAMETINGSPELKRLYLKYAQPEQRNGQNRKDRTGAGADHTSISCGV